jgi:hypothetical protein
LLREGKYVRGRETAGGPAERPVVHVEQSVLLLETEPGLVLAISLHDLGALVAEVVLVGGAIGHPALSQDDDVGLAAERIGEDGTRAQVDVGVVTRGLVRGGTVEVPDGKVCGLPVLLVKGLK